MLTLRQKLHRSPYFCTEWLEKIVPKIWFIDAASVKVPCGEDSTSQVLILYHLSHGFSFHAPVGFF